MDKATRDLWIGGVEAAILLEVKANNKPTKTDLSKAASTTYANAVSRINDLEEKGYITDELDQEDRRNHIVSLTEQGEKMAEGISQIFQVLDDDVKTKPELEI